MVHTKNTLKYIKNGGIYPLVMCYIAMVKPWPIEIDGLPMNSMVDLSMANC